jgi:hypothetical protein
LSFPFDLLFYLHHHNVGKEMVPCYHRDIGPNRCSSAMNAGKYIDTIKT